MTTSDREVVAALGQAIAQRIGEPRYKLWFGHNTKFAWQDDLLIVGVPNHFFKEWLENTFADDVGAAAGDVLGKTVGVRFTIDPQLFQEARREQGAVSDAATRRHGDTATASGRRQPTVEDTGSVECETQSPTKPARRWRRIEEFVVGACNRLAQAAALSVIEAPGDCANPLVLHGPVGTGKTHLLEGIYSGLRQRHPDWRIGFATAEDFTNRFLQAMSARKLGPFRKQFREYDVLLLDGLNFLAGKKATQEEFLHTFDALLANGRQVVVSCDCHPKLEDEFTPELADRLLGGAVWGLQPPDAETRLDILRAKAGRQALALPPEVLQLLAEQLRGNVRELEGTLQSLGHYGRVAGRPMDLRLAREALGELLRHAVRRVELADVDRAVCRAFHLEEGALQAKQRHWAVSHPRMLAIFLARKHTAASYSEIGQHFGGRNHSTAVAAEKKVRRWLTDDGEVTLGRRVLRVREAVELVERELGR